MVTDEWNRIIASLPGVHLLQSQQWGDIKHSFGWDVIQKLWQDEQGTVVAAAQVLRRRIRFAGISFPYSVLYVPRGPILDWNDEALVKRVINDLEKLAVKEKAIQLKIDPEVITGTIISGVETNKVNRITPYLEKQNWHYSAEQIQFKNTVILDLSGTEEEWLLRMKQKTRYNIRLAQKKGVTIRQITLDELPFFYRMYAETSLRDGFAIRSENYYCQVWKSFIQQNMATGLVAEVEKEPVAGLMLFYFANRAWYLYGMSTDKHREKMPNYLLQWEAMRLAKAKGCSVYDLWGAPDVFNATDSMWGVYRFKEGLGGDVIKTIGAWDFSPHPALYRLYTRIIPEIMKYMRKLGKRKTLQVMEQ
jgi:lipid II:glycine glycyltransferase (peptidoglycan interpeptide bridge formation enzyme)